MVEVVVEEVHDTVPYRQAEVKFKTLGDSNQGKRRGAARHTG